MKIMKDPESVERQSCSVLKVEPMKPALLWWLCLLVLVLGIFNNIPACILTGIVMMIAGAVCGHK